jgi:hypothetical protein
VTNVPERWRFNFDNEDVSLRDLTYPDAVKVFRGAEAGELSGQAAGECVSLEFNRDHAAVLVIDQDGVISRPYFPSRSAEAQDLRPFFCGGCDIRVGDRAEYLSRFLSREDGFRLFVAVLSGLGLPSELPDTQTGQKAFPSFDFPVSAVEWRPLTFGE